MEMKINLICFIRNNIYQPVTVETLTSTCQCLNLHSDVFVSKNWSEITDESIKVIAEKLNFLMLELFLILFSSIQVIYQKREHPLRNKQHRIIELRDKWLRLWKKWGNKIEI